ncbi:MAG: hypothetical protein ABW208_18195 [Pyrinomonadaceae bacterium]
MRTLLPFILAAAFLAAAPGSGAQTAPPKELTASERALVAGSRAAIIETGISAAFFDQHFRIARVVDRPGDRRVVWRLSVGGYEATVNDSVGFYTEGPRRVDTHSVATLLPQTSDITRTITRRRAETLMRRCIGSSFKDPQVEYRANGADGHAALLLTAHTVVPPRRESAAERAQREKAEREAEQLQVQDGPARDQLRRKKGGPSPVIRLGAVDLVTGECTVGIGQAGSPKPSP